MQSRKTVTDSKSQRLIKEFARNYFNGLEKRKKQLLKKKRRTLYEDAELASIMKFTE